MASGDLTCVVEPILSPVHSEEFSLDQKCISCLEVLHIKSISESLCRIIRNSHVKTERVGAARRHHPIFTSVECSVKISPSVEGCGLHQGLNLLLRSILRMLLEAFVCLSSFAPAECCIVNKEMASSLPREDMQTNSSQQR